MFYKPADLWDLSQTEHVALYADCKYPWDALKRISHYIEANVKSELKNTCKGRAYIGERVYIGEGTVVEDGVMIVGPAIIGKNCKIRHGAYLRENVIVGDNCTVGNSCEIKNSLLHNNAQVPHFNYVGDSILGCKAHLGAGAALSNIKLAPENIWIEMDGQMFDTGLRKIGALLGDNTDIGCNSVLNPGSIIGRNCMIYPLVNWRGILPDNMIVKHKLEYNIVVRRPRTS